MKENNKKDIPYEFIARYRIKCELNLGELAKLFKVDEKELYDGLAFHSTFAPVDLRNVFLEILKSKGEEFNKERYDDAVRKYIVEIRRLRYINELLQRQNREDYEFTDKDLRNITLYRLEYDISKKEIVGKFSNLTRGKLDYYESNIDDEDLKARIDRINQIMNNYGNAKPRNSRMR